MATEAPLTLMEGRAVLIVDDDRDVRDLLSEIFVAHGYACEVASDGRNGLDTFNATRPPLTITDVKMPALDGLQFLRAARGLDEDAAFIVLTGMGDINIAIQSLKDGAHDFIVKPVNVEELLIAAERALERRQLLMERRQYQATLERRVADATRDLDAAFTQLRETYRATLEALGSALDTRDVGTHSHSRRVHGYSLVIARAHGMPEEAIKDLEHGVLLHDIGKIGIPDSILLKPGALTPDEWRTMRTHPEIGKRLIERIPFLRGAVPVVYCHHERWDGTGYPRGIKGDTIPLAARVFAVADALDAMTFDRPYSRAIPFEAARQEIVRCEGTHFDPAVVQAFLRVPQAVLEAIRRESVEA